MSLPNSLMAAALGTPEYRALKTFNETFAKLAPLAAPTSPPEASFLDGPEPAENEGFTAADERLLAAIRQAFPIQELHEARRAADAGRCATNRLEAVREGLEHELAQVYNLLHDVRELARLHVSVDEVFARIVAMLTPAHEDAA